MTQSVLKRLQKVESALRPDDTCAEKLRAARERYREGTYRQNLKSSVTLKKLSKGKGQQARLARAHLRMGWYSR